MIELKVSDADIIINLILLFVGHYPLNLHIGK